MWKLAGRRAETPRPASSSFIHRFPVASDVVKQVFVLQISQNASVEEYGMATVAPTPHGVIGELIASCEVPFRKWEMLVCFLGFVKLNYRKTAPENFQSRVRISKNRVENPGFYLRFCESYPLGVRKVAF
jgi:hypothetical protein